MVNDKRKIKELSLNNIPMSEDSYEKVIEGIDVVVGTISRLLFPLRIFSYGFDKAQDFLLTKLPEKLKGVSTENLVSPDAKIVIPAINALILTNEETDTKLREMYANLIACCMNKERKDYAHPSFVFILQNMAPEEAVIMEYFKERSSIPIVDINLSGPWGIRTMLEFVTDLNYLPEFSDIFYRLPKHLTNLIRLGLLNVRYDHLFKDEVSYSKLCSFFDVQLKEDESFVYKKGIIELTQFGKDFLNSVR